MAVAPPDDECRLRKKHGEVVHHSCGNPFSAPVENKGFTDPRNPRSSMTVGEPWRLCCPIYGFAWPPKPTGLGSKKGTYGCWLYWISWNSMSFMHSFNYLVCCALFLLLMFSLETWNCWKLGLLSFLFVVEISSITSCSKMFETWTTNSNACVHIDQLCLFQYRCCVFPKHLAYVSTYHG